MYTIINMEMYNLHTTSSSSVHPLITLHLDDTFFVYSGSLPDPKHALYYYIVYPRLPTLNTTPLVVFPNPSQLLDAHDRSTKFGLIAFKHDINVYQSMIDSCYRGRRRNTRRNSDS